MLKTMLVRCLECDEGITYTYRLNHVPSDCCPQCGSVNFEVVQEHYIESPTGKTLTDSNEKGADYGRE